MQSVVLALVGFPGSGKTTVAEYFQMHGFFKVRMGDVTDNLLKEKNLSFSELSEKSMREEIREKFGNDIYAVLVLPGILSQFKNKKPVVIDGLRCFSELEYFRKHFSNLKIIYVDANDQVRFKRLKNRDIRPLKRSEIESRDLDENKYFDTAKLIKIADYKITNNNTKIGLTKKLDKILKILL
jgi:dephospho-CoA kinase